MDIHKFMKTKVFTLLSTATVREAARVVVADRIGTLPIVDEDRKLLGVLSLGQLLDLVMPIFVDMLSDIDFVHDFGAAEESRPDEATLNQPVSDLMGEAVSVPTNCGLVRAYTVMRKLRLYDLPVVDEDNRVVGLAV